VSKRKTFPLVVLIFVALMVAARFLSTGPPEEVPEEPAADTGMRVSEREAFMRKIGYVQ